MTQQTLYKGIFFEATRRRWRVRLYSRGEVYHLSYHDSWPDAVAAWRDASQRKPEPQERAPIGATLDDLFANLGRFSLR